ncbi:hypothetical protein MAR_019592 [Mya arenaria]|uniref:SWIM-type domain-containing protein n=1 Tax=Mya arenaria TaxID=6604 RepID=A0ABY7E606_MYAAR|nr:hypothetical protein MAR_019592 [Mya arenaria]
MIIGGCDPYEAKLACTQNVDIFPSVTYSDIVNYLLFTQSTYSAADLTSYKSLGAYNKLFVCGWVRDTAGIVQGDYLVVTAKVLHSQRMREKPLRPWTIGKRDYKIVAAHCNCITSLAKACSHIAAFLFFFEAAVKIRDSNTVTEEKAYCLLPSACKSIEYKEVRELDVSKNSKEADGRQDRSCKFCYSCHTRCRVYKNTNSSWSFK